MAGVQTERTGGAGLTTTQAPFIEQAQAEGRLYIHQPYELYSEANHEAWRRLYTRMEDRWRRYANPRFLQGIDNLCLDPQRVPKLEDVNRFLSPLTGFKAKPVSGYVPSFLFFDCLRNREFPTTITIRDGATLDYLPGAGHLPRHRRATCRCTPTGPSRTRWCASATAPTRRRRSWRASRTSRSRSGGSPASSRRWRGSSGSPSSSG